MKLVELLAACVKEWDESTQYIYQDGNDTVLCVRRGVPTYKEDWDAWDVSPESVVLNYGDSIYGAEIGLSTDYTEALIDRSQWQAERNRQNGGEWKRHRGGKCPVPAGTKVSTRHRDGEVVDVHFQTAEYGTHKAVMDCVWKHDGSKHDIMAYKVISQPQAEEVEVNIPNAKTVEAMDASDRGEGRKFNSAQDLYAALDITSKAKTDQIDGPVKWRDTVNELDAYIEKYTRERDALIERLAGEGFALIPLVVSVVSEFSGVDFSDWRNWKDGDKIRMTADDWCDLSKGEVYEIIDKGRNYITILDDIDYRRKLDIDGETMFEDGRLLDFEFVSRP